MIILVDFENTHVSGLDGYEYLNDTDTLVMYYSDENSAVTKGMVDDLKKHNVHVSLVKLLKQHSNALDMYIASTTGMFLETGEKICIVSKDKGYAAVRDFWHSLRGAEILLGETIKECFLNSEKIDDERIKLCKERAQKATLVDSFATMNTIPTKPTLSRANQRRKNRNINFTLVSEPASLIPNPLMMETPADQLAKQMQSVSGAEADSKNSQSSKDERDAQTTQSSRDAKNAQNTQPKKSADNNQNSANVKGGKDNNTRANSKDKSNNNLKGKSSNSRTDSRSKDHAKTEPVSESMSHGGYDGIGKVNEASRIENQKRAEAHEDKKAIIKSEPEKTALIPHTEPKTALAKSEPKFDPNRVQFVYDPVSHSMKKVGTDAGSDKSRTSGARPGKSSADPASSKGDDASDVSLSDVSLSDIATTERSQDDAPVETALQNDAPVETGPQDDVSVETTSAAKTDGDVHDAAASEPEVSNDAKKADKKTTAKKAGRTRKTASKKSSTSKTKKAGDKTVKTEDAAAISSDSKGKDTSDSKTEAVTLMSTDSEPTSAEAPAATITTDSSTVESTDTAKTLAEDTKETATTTRKKVGRPKKTAAKSKAKKSAKKDDTDKDTKSSNDIKSSKEANVGKESKESEAGTTVTDSPDIAAAKFGATANTLHTYYVRLMKAYGKEQGRAIYDASKKLVQEDIKKRKAAEKAADKATDNAVENVPEENITEGNIIEGNV